MPRSVFHRPSRVALALAVGWTLVLGALMALSVWNEHRRTREAAVHEARALLDRDLAFRQWATQHGGVYVPVTAQTPPNPYLAHVADRDIASPSGRVLTLMNPAYMLRQMMEGEAAHFAGRSRITSLNPLRPENAPTAWEAAALERFQRDLARGEVHEFTTSDQGQPVLRVMRAFVTEPGCLKCHAHQGYRVGDVRGGIGVTLPMETLLADQRRHVWEWVATLGLVWGLGLAGIGGGYRSVSRHVGERQRAEQVLELQRDLAHRVAHCTSLGEALAHCVDTAIAAGDMDAGGIYLARPDGWLELAYHKGLPEHFVREARLYAPDTPNARLVNQGVPVYRGNDDAPSAPAPPLPAAEILLSVAVVPISDRGRVIGCLNVASHVRRHVPDWARVALETIAAQTGRIVAREQAVASMRESEESFRSFFQSITDLLFVLDTQGHVLSVNEAVTRALGYTEAELVGRSVLDVHPPDRRDEAARIVAGMVAGEVDACQVPLLTKTGTLVPVETVVTPGHWRGQPALFGVSRDVTERLAAARELRARNAQLEVSRTELAREVAERTRAEEDARAALADKEVLLQEVHHRVKNNLQIVSGLLRLQADATADPAATAALAESQDRIQAIALLHEQLYQGANPARLDVGAYVRRLVTHLERAHAAGGTRVRFDLQAPPSSLGLDVAIPCGLIVNELVTNALKHAFRGANVPEHPQVTITWDDAPTHWALRVSDNGRGATVPHQASGALGLRLVHMLARQLRGTVRVDASEQGFSVAVEVARS